MQAQEKVPIADGSLDALRSLPRPLTEYKGPDNIINLVAELNHALLIQC